MTRTGHIAMFGVPAHGHVYPSLPVIRELVDRGYRVTYSISSEFAPLVEEAGATPVCYESTLPSESDPGRSWPEDHVGVLTIFLDEAIAVLPQMEAAYAGDRPDLFLYDLVGFTAQILAARWGIPIVQLSPTYVAWDGFDERLALITETMQRQPAGVDYFVRFAAWLAGQDVDVTVDEFVWHPQRCIALIPHALQPFADRVADSYDFVGPCLDDRAHQGHWEPPDNGRPVLLISLGTAFNKAPQFYRECLAAFGELDWHVVMATGHQVDPAELGPVPLNFEVRRWVPQLSILSRASAFVTHAGMGGVSEGLYHGVPMVAVPQAFDQHMNATRLVELGLGRHLPRDQVTAEVLREAVLSLVGDAGVAARLAAIQEEIRRSGGAAAAADPDRTTAAFDVPGDLERRYRPPSQRCSASAVEVTFSFMIE